ncbi:hypothetical protein Dimus_025145 [Dionaea muscipula]
MINLIQGAQLGSETAPDYVWWSIESSGMFSIQVTIMQVPGCSSVHYRCLRGVWNSIAIPRAKIVLWLAWWNRLSCGERLVNLGILRNPKNTRYKGSRVDPLKNKKKSSLQLVQNFYILQVVFVGVHVHGKQLHGIRKASFIKGKGSTELMKASEEG